MQVPHVTIPVKPGRDNRASRHLTQDLERRVAGEHYVAALVIDGRLERVETVELWEAPMARAAREAALRAWWAAAEAAEAPGRFG